MEHLFKVNIIVQKLTSSYSLKITPLHIVAIQTIMCSVCVHLACSVSVVMTTNIIYLCIHVCVHACVHV